MAKNSKIAWTDHTWNPWIGCSKVSPGCLHCYAETLDINRFSKTLDGGTKEVPVSHWGKGAPRYRTKEANWREPLTWNKDAAQAEYDWILEHKSMAGYSRPRVFCASLSDWLDDEVDPMWLADLLNLIAKTPHLDWLLLTKRPELWASRMDAVCEVDGDNALAWTWRKGNSPENVWVGTTAEDQTRYNERIGWLCAIPARVRFLSCEPQLEKIDLALGANLPSERMLRWHRPVSSMVHWVICGGESGKDARPFDLTWAESLLHQCYNHGVKFFMKQMGSSPTYNSVCVDFKDKKGGDMNEWPAHLRIQSFPTK